MNPIGSQHPWKKCDLRHSVDLGSEEPIPPTEVIDELSHRGIEQTWHDLSIGTCANLPTTSRKYRPGAELIVGYVPITTLF